MFLTVYVFNNSDLIPFNFPFFQTDFQGQERNILNDKIYSDISWRPIKSFNSESISLSLGRQLGNSAQQFVSSLSRMLLSAVYA